MIRCLLIFPVILALSACGSVATLQTRDGKPVPAASNLYQRVLVKDFTHTVKDDKGTTPIAARRFSEKIADSIRLARPGLAVARSGKAAPGTLVIQGEVTRYMEGNAALRLLVGMGAGSAYFDANIYLTDGASGKEIGLIRVDKNSWGPGGGLAATQTVDTFMDAGAKATAAEVAKMVR
jgi:Domain of unknown function (DUF4410)